MATDFKFTQVDNGKATPEQSLWKAALALSRWKLPLNTRPKLKAVSNRF